MKNGVEDFTRFFDSPQYIRLKNYLFNYLNRKRLIKVYSRKFIKGGKIADIGCGISPVSPFPNRTLFIDISKKALNLLKKQGYNVKYGSVTRIPLKSKSKRYVFCSEVLEHVNNYKKGLSEIFRILEDKGYAFITVPCWMNYWNVDDEFVGHYRRFNPYELKKELEEIGFKHIELKNIGSRLERLLTIMLVKNYKRGKKTEKILVPLYLSVNYLLSFMVTLASLFTQRSKASVILFICLK